MGEGRVGRGPSDTVDAGLDTLTLSQAKLNSRVSSLEAQARKSRPRVLDKPTPKSPFVINEVRFKNEMETTVAIGIPPGTEILIMGYKLQGADKIFEETWEDISAAEQAAGQIERLLKKRQEYGKTYELKYLIAKGDFISARKRRNPDPPDDTVVLTSWTAGNFFLSGPSRPELGLIIENGPDLITKRFDAFVVVRIFAPVSASVAFGGTVGITAGSNLITGTGFTGNVAIGQLVTVANQSRLVTAVTNTQITVQADTPFKTTAAGQAMTVSTLQTWAEAGVGKAVTIIPKFRLTDDANAKPIAPHHTITSDEETQTSIDIRVGGLLAPRKYDWVRTAFILNGERGENPALATVTFIAGGYQLATAGIPELTGVAYSYGATEEYNDAQRHVSVNATQPANPVALERAELRKFVAINGTVAVTNLSANIVGTGTAFLTELAAGNQVIIGAQTFTINTVTDNTHAAATANSNATISGQTCYASKRVQGKVDLQKADYHPNGGGVITIVWGDIKTKKLANHIFRTTIYAQNGQTRILDDNFTTSSTDDTAVPGAIMFPAALTLNTVDGDPEKGDARITFTLPTANGQTFAANNTKGIGLVFLRRNPDGTVDAGSNFTEPKVLTAGELGLTGVAFSFLDRIGIKLRLVGVVAINGHQSTESAGSLDFVSGNVRTVDSTDASITVPAPTFQSQPAADGNKIASFTVRLAQDGTSIVLFKQLKVEVSYGGGPYRNIEGSPIGIKALDDLHASTVGSHDFVISCKRKPGVTLDVHATAQAVGETTTGKSSATTGATQLAASADDPAEDTAAPGGTLTPPTIRRLKRAGLRIVLTAPATNNLKLRRASVYIANGMHATASLWVSAADLTASTGTEANGAIECPPAGGHTISVDRATLEAIFGVAATITVYATWTNDVGTSGFSAGATYNLASGETAAVASDSAVPGSLSIPSLEFIPRQGVHIERLGVGANWNTPQAKQVVIYNGAGTYFDLPTYISSGGQTAQSTSEISARYSIGPGKEQVPFAIKLADLKTVFGSANPTNIFVYFYAYNAVGISLKSNDSAAFNLATAKDIMGTRDAVRVIDIAASNTSPGNLLGNGDAVLVNGSDEQENWTRWDGLTTPLPNVGTGGHQSITSTSNQIAYVSSTDSLWMKSGTSWELMQNIKKRLKPGQSYTVAFMVRAAAAVTVTVKLHLYNLTRPVLTGTANATSTTAVVGTGTLFTSELAVGDDIVISNQRRTVASITDNTHLAVTSAFSGASGAINVIIDNINNQISQSVALTTDYQIFLAVISMRQSPNLATTAGGTDYANHRFGVQITSNTQDIYLDYFMAVRGQQQMMFAPRGDENDTLSQGTVPTFVSVPDIIPISGTQGGGKDKDSGGLVSIL